MQIERSMSRCALKLLKAYSIPIEKLISDIGKNSFNDENLLIIRGVFNVPYTIVSSEKEGVDSNITVSGYIPDDFDFDFLMNFKFTGIKFVKEFPCKQGDKFVFPKATFNLNRTEYTNSFFIINKDIYNNLVNSVLQLC